jgi:hypothetical protein
MFSGNAMAAPSTSRRRNSFGKERMEERGEKPTQYVAPGAEKKWRARDLLDIHWNLANIECPESFNRVLSCIIGHANPLNGTCNPRQETIAIETGLSRETVKRAIKWWKKQGFLKTESRGRAHALAYHPQWDLLESFWVGVTSDIEEQKASRVIHSDPREGHPGCATRGSSIVTDDVGQYADPQNLKVITSKDEPQRRNLIPKGSSCDDRPLEGQIREKKEGNQRESFMEASSSSETQRRDAAHARLEDDLLRLPSSQYSAVVEWLPYPGDVYDAAIAAEIDAPNTGAVVVLDAYRKENAA